MHIDYTQITYGRGRQIYELRTIKYTKSIEE